MSEWPRRERNKKRKNQSKKPSNLQFLSDFSRDLLQAQPLK